jgi:hypothetical protein
VVLPPLLLSVLLLLLLLCIRSGSFQRLGAAVSSPDAAK